MPKAIGQLKSGVTVGYAALDLRDGVSGSVYRPHDGDTINIKILGNFGVRFLGVDSPEISFGLPTKGKYTELSNSMWETYLSNPFAKDLRPFDPPLSQRLIDYLKNRVGAGAALNQYHHAIDAKDTLEKEILRDIGVLNQTEEDFRFFLVFANEMMDRYGRFLCFVNRYQSNLTEPKPRPYTYNERLLRKGKVSPYFIWPNINPFRKESVVKAVDSPINFRDKINKDKTLKSARSWVRNARRRKIGIFDETNPLRLEPFEIRFLARRQAPDRWVINLSKKDNILIQPQEYYSISNAEDRLFIPKEYIPLFVENGWVRQ